MLDGSSNITEVIKEISNFFIFLWRDSYVQKYEDKQISKYTPKKHLKRKSSIHLFAVYAFKKHLRERKPLIFLQPF